MQRICFKHLSSPRVSNVAWIAELQLNLIEPSTLMLLCFEGPCTKVMATRYWTGVIKMLEINRLRTISIAFKRQTSSTSKFLLLPFLQDALNVCVRAVVISKTGVWTRSWDWASQTFVRRGKPHQKGFKQLESILPAAPDNNLVLLQYLCECYPLPSISRFLHVQFLRVPSLRVEESSEFDRVK